MGRGEKRTYDRDEVTLAMVTGRVELAIKLSKRKEGEGNNTGGDAGAALAKHDSKHHSAVTVCLNPFIIFSIERP